MQNLGLSDSTPRTEGWLKSLFCPSITSDVDVDDVTTQGFWVCIGVAIFSIPIVLATGSVVGATFALVLYVLGACGVRQRSRFAAVTLFLMQSQGIVHPGIVGTIVLALLLANVRAVWLAHRWRESGEVDVTPPPVDQTFTDALSDKMPRLVWPRGRYLYYALAALATIALPFAFGLSPHASGG